MTRRLLIAMLSVALVPIRIAAASFKRPDALPNGDYLVLYKGHKATNAWAIQP